MTEAKILVIDDEAGIREGCRRVLAPQGYIVDVAENGDEAMNKIMAGRFDLALIDVMMPGISGIELISKIHAHDTEIVCIIITGYATVELAVRAIKQGAYDFLTKPFTTDDLLLVVNQGMERRRLSLETRRLRTIEAEAQHLAEEKARLEELDRAKVAFIRLVTHELQAPISAILTYLELILDGTVAQEEQQETLERSCERAREQLTLIADLLEFGRLKEVKSVSQPNPILANEVLRMVLSQYKPLADEKSLTLTIEIAPELPPVRISADQLKSIWSNLITNAIKYTPSGGRVNVVLRKEGPCLLGQVSDTGIGIPDEAKNQLFSEFFRAGNAKELDISGTGLGLAIVKQIVEGRGGKIWFESLVGKGTTFSFFLPIES